MTDSAPSASRETSSARDAARSTDAPGADSGWTLVCALAVAQLVSWGAIYYSFSLFILPMEAELGWSRSAMNGALSLGLLVAGLAAYPVGAWIDRYGGRGVMTLGSVLASVLLALWSRIESLPWLYVIWVGLGFSLAATLYDPVFAVLTRRFPENYRTRITVLTLIGGFASTVFIPLTQLFVSTLGWRDALVSLAACNAALCIPVHAWLLRDDGNPRLSEVRGERVRGTSDAALRRALRHPVFWGLAVCLTAYYTAFSALTFHVIPMLSERGISMAIIVGAIAVVGPAQVFGRIVLFAFPNRIDTVLAGRTATVLFPASILLLILFPASIAAVFAFAALYGTANGIVTIVRGTAVPDLMWRESYGAINGALTLPSNFAKAAAPFGSALIWSATGDYDAVLWSLFGAALLSGVGFAYAASKREHRAP